MASLSEIMRKKANAAGSTEPAVSRTRTLSEIMGARNTDTLINNANAIAQQRQQSRYPALVENAKKEIAAEQIGANLTQLGKGMVYTPQHVPGADLVRSSVGVPLSSSTDSIQLAQLRNQAEREKENNVGAIAALGAGGSKSHAAQDAYNAFIQKHIDYNQLLNAADFKQYSQQGAAIQNPTFADAQRTDISEYANAVKNGMRSGNLSDIRTYISDLKNENKVGNIVTFSRDNIDAINDRLASDDKTNFVGNALYGFMKDEEVAIYNYLLAKEGEEAAQKYLDYIEQTLNARYGGKIAENVEKTRGSILHPAMVAGAATSAGLDRYISGVKQAFNENEIPTSATQYAGQSVRENQGATGKIAYDAISTISNMAPSILASYVAGVYGAPLKVAEWIGAGSIGLGAGGNAYKQALEEGRNRDEAKVVSVLIGASEAVLSKLLSGISAFGGFAPEKILPKVAAIENAVWRVAATAGVKFGGEVFEE